MSEVVKLERHDVVAIVTVDSPPVNALSAALIVAIRLLARVPHVIRSVARLAVSVRRTGEG